MYLFMHAMYICAWKSSKNKTLFTLTPLWESIFSSPGAVSSMLRMQACTAIIYGGFKLLEIPLPPNLVEEKVYRKSTEPSTCYMSSDI